MGETGSEKGKEIREDGVEDAKGKENRVTDCVETREGSGLAVLPVHDKLSRLHASLILSIFSSTAKKEPPSDPRYVYFRSLLLDLTRILSF